MNQLARVFILTLVASYLTGCGGLRYRGAADAIYEAARQGPVMYCWMHSDKEGECQDEQAQPLIDQCVLSLSAERQPYLVDSLRKNILKCMAAKNWYLKPSGIVIAT